MTILEEMARGYTKSQCIYNVNCNINESCVGCQWLANHITQAQMQNSYSGFIAGYTEALRWRDVNVELPANQYCGNCHLFADETIDGDGWCEFHQEPRMCDDGCEDCLSKSEQEIEKLELLHD